MALAGTIASDDPSAGFSKKEREEQRQVATLIRSVLSAHKVDWEESATQRVTYGPVSHLQSMFEIRGREGRSLQRAEVLRMARDLHPTPAVCGWPRDAAWHFLERAEPMRRALYAGYLGPVHENDLALYVNLRCMQWHGDRATFYAGAGVVPGSDPDAEWAETERKMQTLLRFIPIAEDDVHRQNANAGSGASK